MATMSDLLSRVKSRTKVDTDYPFQDTDLQQLIEDAVNQHNPTYSVDTLPEPEEYLVIWLTMIQVYTILATQFAEDFRTKVGVSEFDMDQPHLHYMHLAQALQRQYSELATPNIIVTTARRVNLRSGRKTALFPGDIQ
jgi:hypothetical protein